MNLCATVKISRRFCRCDRGAERSEKHSLPLEGKVAAKPTDEVLKIRKTLYPSVLWLTPSPAGEGFLLSSFQEVLILTSEADFISALNFYKNSPIFLPILRLYR